MICQDVVVVSLRFWRGAPRALDVVIHTLVHPVEDRAIRRQVLDSLDHLVSWPPKRADVEPIAR